MARLRSLALAAGLGLLQAAAAVHFHPLFTDHAVLQRGGPVPVWGTAEEGEVVTVEFHRQKASAVAVHGRWSVVLRPMRADAEGAVLRVSAASGAEEIHDVVVGEVWIASGQSNMEFALNGAEDSAAAIAASANPGIRLFTVVKRRSDTPLTDLDYAPHHWEAADPKTVGSFSAVGYYFARELFAVFQRERSQTVPVGVIHSSWGGSPVEVWMREGFLNADPEYSTNIVAHNLRQRAKWTDWLTQWEREKAAAAASGSEFKKPRPGQPWRAAELYNGMIASLIPYAIKGAIWYQGEANAGRAWQYRRLYADLIRNWRRDWGQGDFWFFCVQLAPWDKNRRRPTEVIASEIADSDWAELREAQNVASASLPNAGVAVITDAGDKDDIHPRRKEPAGRRLALLAAQRAYGLPVEGLGPAFKRLIAERGSLRVRFSNTRGGLRALDGSALSGFTVAGQDRKFHRAEARVDGAHDVIVSSSEVGLPVAVRYGWADFPIVNLGNGAGLPASPFRTDTWPVTTQPKP